MSPKKKRKRTAGTGRTESSGGGSGGVSAPAAATAAPASASGISRTPLVLDDRRRWPVVVWIALASVWVLGSLVFFVLFLAEGFALMGTQGEDGESPIASMSTAAWYLLGLVVCALVVPVAGAVWALLLRRRIAAILFTVAVVLAAGLLLWLGSPVTFAQAIANGITSG